MNAVSLGITCLDSKFRIQTPEKLYGFLSNDYSERIFQWWATKQEIIECLHFYRRNGWWCLSQMPEIFYDTVLYYQTSVSTPGHENCRNPL